MNRVPYYEGINKNDSQTKIENQNCDKLVYDYLYFAKQSERSLRRVTSQGSEAGPTERRSNAQASASRGSYSQS